MTSYDVAIIGGGAAGLSAALVLSRARRKVLVVDAGSPRNAPAAHMHGFLSRDGMSPSELLTRGRQEVIHYGGVVLADTVTGLVPDEDGGFGVYLADGGGHELALMIWLAVFPTLTMLNLAFGDWLRRPGSCCGCLSSRCPRS
jgi:thioredoxin reductase